MTRSALPCPLCVAEGLMKTFSSRANHSEVGSFALGSFRVQLRASDRYGYDCGGSETQHTSRLSRPSADTAIPLLASFAAFATGRWSEALNQDSSGLICRNLLLKYLSRLPLPLEGGTGAGQLDHHFCESNSYPTVPSIQPGLPSYHVSEVATR